MSQISPPLRILLVGSIVFLAAWMVVLRPGGDTATPPAAAPAAAPAASNPNGAPANTSLGRAVQKANGAAAASDAATAAVTGETAAPATTGSAPATTGSAPAAVAAKVTDVPAWVQEDLGKKVMVLLFWNPKAADDQATRRELRHVADPRFHGKQVVVKAVPISQVSQYAGLTRDAKIEQSPTTLVVDRDRQVETIVGYADRQAISQAVSDALRATKK